ncbi:MAG TPA: polyprenol phosphomannose-dependent alpha 1,6 mannosyltransferase MptB, partial [Acidimicrobiales bacterium]|nr:polyprenol phosphomannose-dependent alpha 1,6 mannosyltransferase MptB [Acidimicrobiales bacterium]
TALLRRCPGVPMWAVWGVFALWLVPLLVGPPLFSRDVYSYAAQGDMVTRGINPYLHGPSSLGWGDPYLNPVDRLWYATPAPYGPLFLGLDAGIVGLTGHHALATVVGLRLLALGGVVLAGAFLPTLARSSGRDPAAVFALAILNPVTLLHLIAGAHNDALMAGFLVAGLALARNRHPVAGVVMCALGAAVKAPAALGILYIGWHWMGPGLPRRERVRPMVSAVMLGGVVLGLLSEVTRLGWGWVRALGAPGAVHSVIDPTTIFGIVTGTFTRLLHLGLRTGQMTSMGRGLGMAVAVVAGVRLLLMSDRLGMVRAAAISLWVVVVLGPVIQPWYLGWPIMLLAPVAGGRLRRLLVATTVAGAFIGFPGGWLLLDELARSSVWAVALSVAVLVSIPGPPVLAWARRQLDGRRRLLTPAPLG